MITTQHTQESMSLSYVHAVAGSAGVNLVHARQFDYGVDGSFRSVVSRRNRRVECGTGLDFQLKCTTNWQHEGSDVAYSVETKTYNDIVTREPHEDSLVLILFCVPKEQASWVEVCEDYIKLQHCCYYQILSGTPVSNERSTKKILIPRANILTANALSNLLAAERARKMGGILP